MRIGIVTPAPRGSRAGNRVTAERIARILRDLGHGVAVRTGYDGSRWELAVVLHARKGAPAVRAWREARGSAPLVLLLAGTDLYRDLPDSRPARASVEAADRLVVLQPAALEELGPAARSKARVIRQSARPLPHAPAPRERTFDVAVLGHLREIKDPFRAAAASRLLPEASRVRIVQVGGAMTAAMARRAEGEAAANPRYRWLGELPRWKARRVLASSRLLCVSSEMEGGANAVVEAIVGGVPVVASRIPGNLGMLGEAWPAYFPVRDTPALAELMRRAESDPDFLDDLRRRTAELAPLFAPAAERAAWRSLLAELPAASRPPGE